MHILKAVVFCAIVITNAIVPKIMTWTNWAGNQTCQPASIFYPKTKDELTAFIQKASSAQKTIRIVGAGHSWSAIVCTDDYMINLKNLDNVLSVDTQNKQITVQAGITLEKLNTILDKHGLALANQPAVLHMTIGGLTATGTHGSGKTGSLSNFIIGGELIIADGTVLTISEKTDPEVLSALRVSMGSLGIVYSLTLQCVPQFTVHECFYTSTKDELVKNYTTLYADNNYFQCVWNLKTDTVRMYTRNKELKKSNNNVRCKPPRRSYESLSSMSAGGKRLEEEIAVPLEDLPKALADIQRLAKQFEDKGLLVQELLIRFVQADKNSLLSMTADRASCFLSISTPVDTHYYEFYKAFEAAMMNYKGRPHWGKVNFLTQEKARQLYGANFDRFIKIKNRLDPNNIFSNRFTNQLFEQK